MKITDPCEVCGSTKTKVSSSAAIYKCPDCGTEYFIGPEEDAVQLNAMVPEPND